MPRPIRQARAADAAALFAISEACFGGSGWSRPLFDDLLAVANRRGGSATMVCLLARDTAGTALGYIAAQVAAGEVEIHSLAVAPRAQRHGWGSRLLRAAMTAGGRLGATEAHLEVRVGNRAARAFYSRHGFIETGMRSGYYPDTGEAALLMRRGL